jgi:hypothetical protein
MARREHALGWHLADWSDFEIRLAIVGQWVVDEKHPRGHWLGAPFSWKRARQITKFSGHASIGLTTDAKQWARAAVAQLRLQWSEVFAAPIPKTIPLNAAIVSYLPTRRLTDASNLYQGPEDVMQACGPRCKPKCKMHAGVIEDDSAIESHDGSARRYDKTQPRVEIVLTRKN